MSNLQWRKNNAEPSLPVQTRGTGKRLDLTDAQSSDLGIYVCIDVATGTSVSINVTGGKKNVQAYYSYACTPRLNDYYFFIGYKHVYFI